MLLKYHLKIVYHLLCIIKADGLTTDDAEDLDLVMPMYNFREYSSNYSEVTESLWFYSKDESTKFNNNIENTDNLKLFKFKARLWGNTVTQPVRTLKTQQMLYH